MGKLGFKYSSKSPFSSHCIILPPSGVENAGQEGRWNLERSVLGFPHCPLVLGRLPASSCWLLGPSFLVFGNSGPQSPAHQPLIPSHMRHRHRMLGIRQFHWVLQPQALPLVNFSWCLSLSASILLFFLSSSLPTCAYSYRDPRLRVFIVGGNWGSQYNCSTGCITTGSFVILLGFFFLFLTVHSMWLPMC